MDYLSNHQKFPLALQTLNTWCGQTYKTEDLVFKALFFISLIVKDSYTL